MVWVALAVMTGLALGFVLWPLAFRSRETPEADREAAFYRAQLAEIARDVERGLLPAPEAEAARVEAARRLLAVTPPAAPAPSGALGRRRLAAVAAFAFLPALALAVYFDVGQPDLPDAPLAARKADASAPGALDSAIAKIEAHLMQAPNDRRGWEVLAPVYMRLGRFADAAGAYKRVIAIGPDSLQLHADLGEALVAMADGVVTADARAELEKAPDLPMSKFYLALGLEQDGKVDEAKAAYTALAPQAKGAAPWAMGLRARLAALNGGGPPLAAAAPAKDAPASFSPEQKQMIEGMVQGLADRLAKQGGAPDDWARLIRAYSVLHEDQKARDALASARHALGPNTDLDALAKELGI